MKNQIKVITMSLAAVALLCASIEALYSNEGYYIKQGVRQINNLAHSHTGLETAFGYGFQYLNLGMHSVYRPASWSSHRQSFRLSGAAYKGKQTLQLGEHYALVGLQLSPRVRNLWQGFGVALPITLGSAALGTPLMDGDRNTPDGRRVSAWEDELLEGEDIWLGLGYNVGFEISYKLPSMPIEFALGAHYTDFVGYKSPIIDKNDVDAFGISFTVSVVGL